MHGKGLKIRMVGIVRWSAQSVIIKSFLGLILRFVDLGIQTWEEKMTE